LPELAGEVVRENRGVLETELMYQLQVRKETGDDNNIGVYTSPAYVKRKQQYTQSPYFDGVNVDLFVTGYWQQSIGTQVEGMEYDFVSTSFITPFLGARYGSEIMQLSTESRNNVRPKLDNIFVQVVLKGML
jgi:hypothetical protein